MQTGCSSASCLCKAQSRTRGSAHSQGLHFPHQSTACTAYRRLYCEPSCSRSAEDVKRMPAVCEAHLCIQPGCLSFQVLMYGTCSAGTFSSLQDWWIMCCTSCSSFTWMREWLEHVAATTSAARSTVRNIVSVVSGAEEPQSCSNCRLARLVDLTDHYSLTSLHQGYLRAQKRSSDDWHPRHWRLTSYCLSRATRRSAKQRGQAEQKHAWPWDVRPCAHQTPH